MKRASLTEMERLLEMKFQRKQHVFSKVVAEENRLRAQIRQLDEQARDAAQTTGQPLRAIGADVIWKAWVDRTKTSLNLELAQVLAQKERLRGTVRKEFGKVQVSRHLIQDCGAQEDRERRQKALLTSVQSHFFLNARKPPFG